MARADEPGFILQARDHQFHALASMQLTLIGTAVARDLGASRWKSILTASLAALAVGTFKEVVLDDHFSASDEGSNLIGIGSGAVLAFTIRL